MNQSVSFKQSWDVLRAHAQTLRAQAEPDIDNLLTIVSESVAAYKNCKTRLESIEASLQQTLSEADGEGGGGGS